MAYSVRILSLLFCTAVIVLAIASTTAIANPVATQQQQSQSNDPASDDAISRKKKVIEWFKRYDQIRRDAEMSLADKFQVLLMSTGDPEKRSFSLASRMLDKYKHALSEIKSLDLLPETKNLQEGYKEYFDQAAQILESHLKSEDGMPLDSKSFGEIRKNLQELDDKNKQLDDDLRKEYGIPKHRHS